MGYEDLKGKDFSSRTIDELLEIAKKGGKASGEARRKKADFRKTLNQLLTIEIDNPEWSPLLNSLGLDSTLESAVNMAMIKEALSGSVKAYEAIAKYSGQSDKAESDMEEQKARVEQIKANTERLKRDGGQEEDGEVVIINDLHRNQTI